MKDIRNLRTLGFHSSGNESGSPYIAGVIGDGDIKVGEIWVPKNQNFRDLRGYLELNGERGIYIPFFNDCHTSIFDGAEGMGGSFITNQSYEGRVSWF